MAKRDVHGWPVVAATLRSAVFDSEGSGVGLEGVFLLEIPLLGLILGLIFELVQRIRGHRVRLMYTYRAGDKYHAGFADRFVRNTGGTPLFYGRAPGQTIYVRYNPEKPSVSVVLAEDNPH